MSILRTRLFKPKVSKGYIIRPRLFESMIANRHKSICKVVAPAGYGKSVFISQWLDEIESPHCWITLEDDCNVMEVFLEYLIEAIKSTHKTGHSDLESLKNLLERPKPENLAKLVVNEIHQINEQAVIVLDDYHTITNKEVHLFLTELLNHFPEHHSIILISRFDPPLDLRRLIAYDRVNEIRMADLMFSEGEIVALSETQTEKPISSETAAFLYNSTEGWIVPIRLWLKELSSKKMTDLSAIEKNPERSGRLTNDLLEDVFSSLDASVKENMMFASLYPRFSIKMLRGLHQLLHPEEAFDANQMLLEKFIDRSLFIIALDDEDNWYRFHHLVQLFLQSRSKRKFTSAAISKAIDYGSAYFAVHDSIYLAIQLSITNEDYPRAINYFNSDRYSLFDNQRFDQFRARLSLFPRQVIESDPSLLLIRAMLHGLAKKMAQMSDDLDLVKEMLPPLDRAKGTTRLLWGEYYSNEFPLLFKRHDLDRILPNAIKAMDLLRNKSSYLHDHAMAFYVLALNAGGKPGIARTFLVFHEKQLKSTDFLSRMNSQTLRAILGFMQGRLSETLDEALSARRLALDNTNSGILLMANLYIAVTLYQRNDLESGMQYLREAWQGKYLTRPTWILECYFLKCLFQMAMSADTSNEECIEEMMAFQQQFGSSLHDHLTALMRTELFLRRGEANRAWDTWKQVSENSSSYSYHYYQSDLTEVTLLMADHPLQNLARAEELLNRYEKLSVRTNNKNLYYQTSALKVVLYGLKSDFKTALDHLRGLLSKTKQESIIRLYTDHGNPMQAVLEQLSEKEKSDPYIVEISRSFKRTARPAHNDAPLDKPRQSTENAIEISQNETQILQLIADGYQNKEIAEKLYYSLGTIKTYVYNLYQKIGVRNRAEAIRYFKERDQKAPAKIQSKA